MSKKIKLTKGKYAIVDDEDFEWLSCRKWYAQITGEHLHYAARQERQEEKWKMVWMHRAIYERYNGKIAASIFMDHIDGNGFNNRKSNLRLATRAQNSQNRRLHKNNTSGYMGVHRRWGRKTWRAEVSKDGVRIHRSTHDTREQAARAYDAAARKYHGEFATLNFPLSQET